MKRITQYPNGMSSFGNVILDGGKFPTQGNTYIVGVSTDTNYAYLKTKYGSTAYANGVRMFHSNLQSAIDACVDWRGDRIICGKGTQVVTTPVLFNKKAITIQAGFNISGEDNGERFSIDSQGTSNIAAAIVSEPCTIIGMGISGTSTASGALQTTSGSGFDGGNFMHLIGCRFTNWGHAAEAITLNYNDYVKIENCSLDGTINGDSGSANVFVKGINITQGHYVSVINSTFRGCTYSISHGTPNPATADHSNKNLLYKGNNIVDGKFVDWNTTATYTLTSGLVADNWIGVATGTGVYSESVATTQGNCAGLRFAGNHYAE